MILCNMILHGKVQSGLGIGKKIGFPTLNLFFKKNPDLSYGVYAAYGLLSMKCLEKFPLLVHFGPRPTIKDAVPTFEVYFLNYPEGTYFSELHVEILGKLRDIEQFDSLEKLSEQIQKDKESAIVKYFQKL